MWNWRQKRRKEMGKEEETAPLSVSPTITTDLTHTHYRPHPQPLSKGRGEWNAMQLQGKRIETKHTTPLSPWRGVGGEALLGGVGRPIVGAVGQ